MEELGVLVPNQANDRGGRHVGRDGGFGPGLERAAQRPRAGAGLGLRAFDDGVDLGEGGAAVPVQGVTPFHQLFGHRVLALGRQAARAGPVAVG